jgi:hypothetical protein
MIKTFGHYVYWSLIFFTGLIQFLGLPSGIYKVGIPLVAGLLFLYTFIQEAGRLVYPFVGWFLGFVFLSVTSSVINRIDSFSLIYFLIYTLLSYTYFVILVNERNIRLIKSVIAYLKILVLIQIPVVIVKYFVLGQSEKGGIGTLSINAGSVSTIFPVLVITVLICYFLFSEKMKYLLLIGGFCLFAIVGAKRAIIFFIPIVLVLSYFLFYKMNRMIFVRRVAQKLVLIALGGGVAFYVFVRTNPTLNPEHSIGGSFDTEYLTKYVTNYTSSAGKNMEEMRRKDGLFYFINYISSGTTDLFLWGDGAGKLIQSKYNVHSGTMNEEYGVRYGGRMGFVWLLLQVGILGTLLYLLFYVRLYWYVSKRYLSHPIYLAFLVLTIIFFIDLVIYSDVFLRYEYLKGLYFVLLGMIYLDQKYSTTYFTNLLRF